MNSELRPRRGQRRLPARTRSRDRSANTVRAASAIIRMPSADRKPGRRAGPERRTARCRSTDEARPCSPTPQARAREPTPRTRGVLRARPARGHQNAPTAAPANTNPAHGNSVNVVYSPARTHVPLHPERQAIDDTSRANDRRAHRDERSQPRRRGSRAMTVARRDRPHEASDHDRRPHDVQDVDAEQRDGTGRPA